MRAEGCVCIDGGTIEEVVDFLKRFPPVCHVHASNNKIVVDVNYTQG